MSDLKTNTNNPPSNLGLMSDLKNSCLNNYENMVKVRSNLNDIVNEPVTNKLVQDLNQILNQSTNKEIAQQLQGLLFILLYNSFF